jgi:hypothetical protein
MYTELGFAISYKLLAALYCLSNNYKAILIISASSWVFKSPLTLLA